MSELLDELARTLVRPMPRTRVLRLIGGAVAGVLLPIAKASASPSTHNCPQLGLVLCQCPAANGLFYKLCCWSDKACTCDIPKQATCCVKPKEWNGSKCVEVCQKPCRDKCCEDDEFCANPAQGLCCKQGEERCADLCCKKNEECVRSIRPSIAVCVPRCPQGRARCGKDKCCPKNWRCANPSTGLCKRCGPNEEECERKCCDKRTSQCCGKAGCCPKNRTCCNMGDKQVCCPPREKCAVPILAGNIGIKPGTKVICCPQERLNNSPKLCCPPGMVALNSPGFRTPPPGVPPDCCPRGQVCASGGRKFCANFQSDAQNCGSCGNECESGICSGGVCALP